MTAIMRAEHQEPEVARFIDSYKYDQQTAERRQKYGGGTSLPLDSDGYEDRQRKLKEELRNDFLVQQEKPSDPVYFRVGTPEQGLRGLGQYEHLRQEMNIKRQREYNDFLREKKNLELQKIEARRNRSPPPVTQPPAGQIDYDQQNLRARTEDRRAYQDHMGKYHQAQAVTVKPPINYEEERRRLSEELKQEYNQFMEKKAQEERYWRMRGKPVTPPGGLDIGHYDKHVKEQAPQKKKEYKETLDQQRNEKLHHRAWERVADISPSHMHYRDEERPLVGSPRDVNFYMREQQKEQMYIRARQEPEMPVLDRSPPQQATYLASKPPPGPQQGHLQRDQQDEEQRRHEEVRRHRGTPAGFQKDHHYSSDEYEKFQRNLQKQEGEEYREFLKKEFQPPLNAQGLPLGQYKYEPKRLALEAERNREYNALLRAKPKTPQQIDGPQGLNIDVSYQDKKKVFLEKERNRDYNDLIRKKYTGGKMTSRSEPDRPNASFYVGAEEEQEMKKRYLAEERSRQYNQMLREQEPPRSRSVNIPSDVDSGLPIGQQHHEAWRRFLREQRNREYNQMMDTKNQEVRNREWNFGNSGVLDLRGDDENQSRKQLLREERQKEYNEFMNQQRIRDPPRHNDYFDPRNGPYDGIFSGLGDHGNTKEVLGQQRKQEYNQYLDQYPQTKAGGRPTWVKETLPNNTDRGRSPMRNPQPVDHYQQMLDEKRREEAQRRRFDDPEYQGRLPPNSREARYNEDMQQQKYGYYQQE